MPKIGWQSDIHGKMNLDLMNYKAVCNTAPATPGLLHMLFCVYLLFSYKMLYKRERNSSAREGYWGPHACQKLLKTRVFLMNKRISILLDNLIAKSFCANIRHHKSNIYTQWLRKILIFIESAHWADSIIESRCPSVCVCVCPFSMRVFSRPLIGPQVT